MPTIKGNTAAPSTDLLANVKFADVGGDGAIINAWVACAANGGTFGFSIGDRDLVVAGTEANIEVSADCIDTARDQVLFDEVVEPGHLYMPCGAAGTELQYQIHVRYL